MLRPRRWKFLLGPGAGSACWAQAPGVYAVARAWKCKLRPRPLLLGPRGVSSSWPRGKNRLHSFPNYQPREARMEVASTRGTFQCNKQEGGHTGKAAGCTRTAELPGQEGKEQQG